MRKKILVKEIDELIKDLKITITKERQHVDYYFYANIATKVEIEKTKLPDTTMPIVSLIAALFAILIGITSVNSSLTEFAISIIVGCAVIATLLILVLIRLFYRAEKKNKEKLGKLILLQELLSNYLKI